MSISGRKQVKWEDEPWEEHTSTLVLVSRRHNYYTDLRVLDPDLPPRAALPQCLPSPPSPVATTPPQLSAEQPKVQWAFAGTFDSTHGRDGEGRKKKDTTWHHWIDSHFKGEVVDFGTSYDYGERWENLSIEKGRALNPGTGLEQSFEEIWLDFPVDSIPSLVESASTTIRSSRSKASTNAQDEPTATATGTRSGNNTAKNKVCMVLRAESETFSVRGLVVRVGAWCQGIIKTGVETSAERWRWVHHEHATEGGWEPVVKIGSGSVPCRSLWEKEDMVVGDQIQSGGLKWELVEKDIWE